MNTTDSSTLIDPQNGNLAFKIFSFSDDNHFDHIQRLDYHTMILILQGEAQLKADFSEYLIRQSCLLYFSPYQPFMLNQVSDIDGICINFHSDFFCIHKHHQEIACNGVLFNNIYRQPYILLEDPELREFIRIIDQMKEEMKIMAAGQYE